MFPFKRYTVIEDITKCRRAPSGRPLYKTSVYSEPAAALHAGPHPAGTKHKPKRVYVQGIHRDCTSVVNIDKKVSNIVR